MTRAYRKKAVLEVGGHDEKLQIKEDEELNWRLTEAGYKLIRINKESYALHLESSDRFTLRDFLKKEFSYAYWYHILFYKHPRRILFAAWPMRVLGVVLLLMIGTSFNVNLLPLLTSILLFILTYLGVRIYRNAHCAVFTISKFRSKGKVKAFLAIILLEFLGVIALDIGRIYGMTDKLLGRVNFNIR